MLLKGFEVELFTGTFAGANVGVASAVSKDLLDFVKEPDQRNIEYITVPAKRYSVLKEALLKPRQKKLVSEYEIVFTIFFMKNYFLSSIRVMIYNILFLLTPL